MRHASPQHGQAERFDRDERPAMKVGGLALDQEVLAAEMWRLAKQYEDLLIFNRYATVAFARPGPIGVAD